MDCSLQGRWRAEKMQTEASEDSKIKGEAISYQPPGGKRGHAHWYFQHCLTLFNQRLLKLTKLTLLPTTPISILQNAMEHTVGNFEFSSKNFNLKPLIKGLALHWSKGGQFGWTGLWALNWSKGGSLSLWTSVSPSELRKHVVWIGQANSSHIL